MTEAIDPLIGSQLGGRYEIVGRIGKGGTAVVYRARDLRLGRTVAVKVIRDDLTGDPDYVKRFDREARAAAILSHPNIVAVFDQGHEGDRSYIVMEYIRGQSLRQIISTSAPLPPSVALTYMDAIAKALAAAHDAGIIHRDIKPENVLITNDGQVKVTDFGLAKSITAHSSTATTGVLMGTISYMPPEIPQNGTAQMSSDVYSAGIVLYEMLTGLKPHRGDDVTEVIMKHVKEDVPPPSQVLTGEAAARIPDYVDALVHWCTARDPDKRPANGRDLESAVTKAKAAVDKGILHDPSLTREFMNGGLDDPDIPLATDDALTVSIPFGSQGVARGIHEPTPIQEGSAAATPLSQAPQKALLKSHTKTKKRRVLPIVLLIVIVLVGGVSAWWGFAGQWTTAPLLTGKTEQDAQQIIAAAELTLTTEKAFSEDVPAGVIISTKPEGGDRIRKHGTMSAVVSLGPERYAMPPVAGLSQADAEEAIRGANLTVGTVTQDWSETVPVGSVISASQNQGDSLMKGTTIDLVVSQGRQPISIESFVGKTKDEAMAALGAAGFEVTLSEENSSTVPAGTVIRQEPSEGEKYRGETINLVVSSGPLMGTIPEKIVGKTRQQAIDMLNGAGFTNIKVENANSTGVLLGMITAVKPASGTDAPLDSTVILYLV